MIYLSVAKNDLNTTFELVNRGRPFFKAHALLIHGLDKALCGMHESLIIETINTNKVLNFRQSLTNEKKVIKSLTTFHMFHPFQDSSMWWLRLTSREQLICHQSAQSTRSKIGGELT